MFFSGLNNIDFAGLGALSGEMPRSELFTSLRIALQPGTIYSVSDDQINQVMDAVLAKYKLIDTVGALDKQAAESVDADVRGIVLGVLKSTAVAYRNEIDGVVQALKNRYSLVPKDFVAKTAATSGTTPFTSGAQPSFMTPTIQQQAQQQVTMQPQIRFVTRPKVMTAKEKNKLTWILGIGAFVFVAAMGLLAAKSGD